AASGPTKPEALLLPAPNPGSSTQHQVPFTTNRYVPDATRYTTDPCSLRSFTTPTASPDTTASPSRTGTQTIAEAFTGTVTSTVNILPSLLQSLPTSPRRDAYEHFTQSSPSTTRGRIVIRSSLARDMSKSIPPNPRSNHSSAPPPSIKWSCELCGFA